MHLCTRRALHWLLPLLMLVALPAGLLAQDTAAAAPATEQSTTTARADSGSHRRYQTTPTALSVPGYTTPDPEKATTKDLAIAIDKVAQSTSRNYFASNFIWTLVAGLPGDVHAGRLRAGRDGPVPRQERGPHHGMNFMVYALGMLGFFICGFALHVRRLQRHRHRRAGQLGGVPTLRSSPSVTVGDRLGLCRQDGFFLTGKAYDAPAISGSCS